MSELPMRGHFRYLRFKTFSMTSRTPQCEVFCPLLSSSEHSGVPEDSQPPTFPSVRLHPTLGQSGVAQLKDLLPLTQFKPKKRSYCDRHLTNQFLLLTIEIFECFHKQVDVFLHDCANDIWSFKRCHAHMHGLIHDDRLWAC
jgi:hypothetical protein